MHALNHALQSKKQIMRRLVVPQGLDLEKIVDELALIEPRTSKDKIRRRIKFLLSSIIYGSITRAKVDSFSDFAEEKGARLSSVILKKILGEHVKKYIDLLVQHQIIIVKNGYCVGEYSKEYALASSFRGCVLEEELIESKEFAQLTQIGFKKKRSFTKNSVPQTKKPHSHQMLQKVFEMKKLKINEEGARAWINRHCDDLLKSGVISKFTQAHPEHKRFVYNVMVDSFVDYEYNFNTKYDVFGRRFHSLLTYCPSGLRQFLTWDGEPLVALDLKNSQPYLLNVMFNKEFVGGAGSFSLRGLMPELHEHLTKMGEKKKEVLHLEGYPPHIRTQVLNSASKKQISPLFIMLQNTPQSLYFQGVEKVNFQSLVKEGTLYDFIQLKFQGKYKERPPQLGFRFKDRNSTKKEVLFMLYHNPSDSKRSARIKKPYQHFVELFPAQGNVLNLIKSKDYKDAPRLLQRIESYLFLEKIAKPLIQQGIPVLTIHDSIVIPESDVPVALKLMKNVLTKHIGEKPSISEDKWF